MRDLRDRLYVHLQGLSLGFFSGTRTGEIQSRIANDVGGVQNVVTTTVSNVLSNTVIVISTVAAMTVLSWQLTVVAVGTTPIFSPSPNWWETDAVPSRPSPKKPRRT